MESGPNMNRHIIIDGFPANVDPSKHEMMRKFATTKITAKLGHSSFVLHITIDHATGFINGAFLTFVKPADAEHALSLLNHYVLTKDSKFETFRWSALNIAKEELAEYQEPDYHPEIATEVSNAMMQDPLARPMFLTKSGQHQDVELYWYDNAKQKVDLFKKPAPARDDGLGQICEMDRRMGRMAQPGLISGPVAVQSPLPIWTPLGSMLVSQHQTGLKFWGGESFAQLFEVAAEGINAFQISPRENFLIVRTDRDISVWNLKQSRKLKVLGGFNIDQWPVGRFNEDDSLLAFNRVNEDGTSDLLVYDTTSGLTLLQASKADPHSYTFRLPNLQSFEWSPGNPNHITLIYSGDQHVGWCVTVEEMTADDGVATLTTQIRRNFLGANQVVVLWHPEGNGLAAKITKVDKGVEIIEYCLFRIAGRNITADHFKIESTFVAQRFSWQPGGKYFAVLLCDKATLNAKGESKMVIRFYAIDGKGLKAVGSFPSIATSIHWAPKGTRCVAANYDRSNMEFYGINDAGIAQAFEKAEHPSVGDTQWDPSGRFFASWNTCLRTAEGCRYRIFDMNGVRILEKKVEKFSHLMWRPLAKPVLAAEEVNHIRQNLKSIVEQYEAADFAIEEAKTKDVRDKQTKAEREYKTRMDAIARHHAKFADIREQLRASAPMAIRQRKFLAALPEESRMVTETVTESRVKSRDEIKK